MPYIVALRYTKGAGGYCGVVTWTQFPSKEEFDKVRKQFLNSSNQEVVEEGITDERAIELSKQTPAECRINAAVEESRIPGTNLVDGEALSHHLTNAILAEIL